MSVTASVCSSSTSDKVILLPLLGTSNRSTAPDDSPNKGKKIKILWHSLCIYCKCILTITNQSLAHLPTQMYLSLTAAIPRAKMALANIQYTVHGMSNTDKYISCYQSGIWYYCTCGCLWCVQCMPVYHNGSIRLIHLLDKHNVRLQMAL